MRCHRDEARSRAQRCFSGESHRATHAGGAADDEHVTVTSLVRRASAHRQRGLHGLFVEQFQAGRRRGIGAERHLEIVEHDRSGMVRPGAEVAAELAPDERDREIGTHGTTRARGRYRHAAPKECRRATTGRFAALMACDAFRRQSGHVTRESRAEDRIDDDVAGANQRRLPRLELPARRDEFVMRAPRVSLQAGGIRNRNDVNR